MQVRKPEATDPTSLTSEQKFQSGKILSQETISSLNIKNADRDMFEIHRNFVKAFELMCTGFDAKQWTRDNYLVLMRNFRYLMQNLNAPSRAGEVDWGQSGMWEFRLYDFHQCQLRRTKVDYRYYIELALACVQYPAGYAALAYKKELNEIEIGNMRYYLERTEEILNILDEMLPCQEYMDDSDYRCLHAEIYQQLARAYGGLRDLDKTLSMASTSAHYFALNGGRPVFDNIAEVYADLALVFANRGADKNVFEFARDFFIGKLVVSYADLEKMVEAFNEASDPDSHRNDIMLQIMRLMEAYLHSVEANTELKNKWQNEFAEPFQAMLKKKQEAVECAQMTAKLSDLVTLQAEIQSGIDRANAILANARVYPAVNNLHQGSPRIGNHGLFPPAGDSTDSDEEEMIVMHGSDRRLNQ